MHRLQVSAERPRTRQAAGIKCNGAGHVCCDRRNTGPDQRRDRDKRAASSSSVHGTCCQPGEEDLESRIGELASYAKAHIAEVQRLCTAHFTISYPACLQQSHGWEKALVRALERRNDNGDGLRSTFQRQHPDYTSTGHDRIASHKPTYRYKPVPVSALAIYHPPRKSLESQLQRSLARQAGGAPRTGSRGNPHSSDT